MKLTNHLNLPPPLVAALSGWYTQDPESDYSVTELLDPPRKRALQRQHDAELTEDAADRIWSALGSAVHAWTEKAAATLAMDRENGWRFETRMRAQIAGRTVSGQTDWWHPPTGAFYDLKVTSVWALVYDRGEYDQQLNAYAHLWRANGHEIKSLTNVLILRDWVKSQAGDGKYPPHQIAIVPRKLWAPADAEAFLADRVRLHDAARTTLPDCNDEERWQGFDRKTKQTVYRRCQSYCAAYPVCTQAHPEARA